MTDKPAAPIDVAGPITKARPPVQRTRLSGAGPGSRDYALIAGGQPVNSSAYGDQAAFPTDPAAFPNSGAQP